MRTVAIVSVAALLLTPIVPVLPVHAQAVSATVGVEPAARTVAVGESLSLQVRVNLTGGSTRGWQFGLTFSPTVVRVDGITAGTWLQDVTNATAAADDFVFSQPFSTNNSTGEVSPGGQAIIGGPSTAGATGEAVLATIQLTALANGTSSIELRDVIVDRAPTTTVNNGRVQVGAATGTATATATPTPPGATATATSSAITNTATATTTGQPQGTATVTTTGQPGTTATPSATGGAGVASATAEATWTPKPAQSATATPTLVPRATVAVEPATQNVNPGDVFTVDVKLSLDPGEKSRGIQFGLQFDPSVVRVNFKPTPPAPPAPTPTVSPQVDVTVGSFYSDWARSRPSPQPNALIGVPFVPNNEQGTTSLGAVTIVGDPLRDGPTGSGTVLKIGFVAVAAGQSAITLTNVRVSGLNQLGDEEAKGAVVQSGQVVVSSQTSTPGPTTTPTPSPSPTQGTPSPTVSPTPSPSSSPTTPSPTVSPSRTITPSPSALPTATATAYRSPTPQPTFTPSSNFTATPDVPAGANAGVSISPTVTNVQPGATATVAIAINASRYLRGIEFGLKFDPAVIEVDGVDEGPYFKDWAQANSSETTVLPGFTVDNVAGTVALSSIAILGIQNVDNGPSGPGIVAVVRLRGKANGTSALTLTEVVPSSTRGEGLLAFSITGSNLTVTSGEVRVGSGTVTPTPTGTVGLGTPTPTLGPGTPSPTLGPGTPSPTVGPDATAALAGGSGTGGSGGTGVAQPGSSGGVSSLGSVPGTTGSSTGSAGAAQAGTAGGAAAAAAGGAAGAGQQARPGSTAPATSPGGAGGVGGAAPRPPTTSGPTSGGGNAPGVAFPGPSTGPGGTLGTPDGAVSGGLGLADVVGTSVAGGSPTGGVPGVNQRLPGRTPSLPAVLLDLSDAIDTRGVLQKEVRLSTPDGAIKIFIPRGTRALTGDKRPLRAIQYQYMDDHPVVADDVAVVGRAVELGPSGATFDRPITVALAYDPAQVPQEVGEHELEIAFFHVDESRWVSLPGTADPANRTITVAVGHFTTFAVITKSYPGVSWALVFGTWVIEAALGAVAYVYVRRRRQQAAADSNVDEPGGDFDDFGAPMAQPPDGGIAGYLLPGDGARGVQAAREAGTPVPRWHGGWRPPSLRD